MKTIVNKLRFALLLGFVAIGMTVLAQDIANIEKLTTTTQMFLEEMAGKISFDNQNKPSRRIKAADGLRQIPTWRPIARPDTIDGEIYISAFIRVNDDKGISDIEQLGVIVQCQFDNGLMTALIPVDRIDELADLECVTRVNVASLKKSLTDVARQTTNTDDVLAYTADAISANLPHGYDGSGIVLGVIDSGIDFQHIAFKDKNGNPRIKRAYRYAGSGSGGATEYTGTGNLPTADATDSDHGTHTSSIAGGSSVIVSGTNVTVTDNHSSATYGGMAPGTDLYLCGIADLTNTYIANSFQKICGYADAQNQPVVVSNSWGSAYEDHDGHSDMSSLFAQYFGDTHPNHICVFASGNEAGMAESGYPGGYYISGNSTSNAPIGTIVKTLSWVTNQGVQYYGLIANAWTRATNATGIGVNIYVLNTSGGIVRTYNFTSSNGTQQFTPEGMTGTLNVGFYTSAVNGKKQVLLSTNYLQSDNVLAIEVYSIGGSTSVVDIWGGSYSYLSNYLTTNGHSWTAGNDDMTAGDEATDLNVISVGSYVSRYYYDNSAGDISSFSSYAVEGVGPSGRIQPWITAPGEIIISAMNHSATSHDVYQTIVNSSTNPYGSMAGTSMAAPAAAGIVALWMQAAQEVGKDMTVNDIKEVMKESAIHDQWTNGTHANRFGYGKINALGGIEYILREYGDPTITVSSNNVTFDGAPGGTYTETISVSGIQLTDDIIAELNDPNGVYTINRSVNLGSGGDLVITYAPTSQGNHNATITLTSTGAESQTITVTGTSRVVTEATVADGRPTNYYQSYLPIYGNQYNNKQINQMIYPASMLTEIQGKKIKSMTFYPTTPLNFYGGEFTVKVGMTTQTAYTSSNNFTRITANMQTVKTGQVAVRNDTELVITFDEPFEYTGNNLVIDFEVTATGTRSSSQNFYGLNQSSTYRSFNSYGTTINNRGIYNTSNRRAFLPTVTFKWDAPFVAGELSDNSLTFTDAIIGNSEPQTVTITNTGNMPFTPVIDTTNLPSEFEVTGNGNIAVGGTLDLTVTYSPTDEGPHSGSFTVTIGDQAYTVIVSGNGITVTSTLISNTVMVPVYKSEAQPLAGIDYVVSDIDGDTDHGLAVSNSSGDINIQVVGNDKITSYDLYREDGGSWTAVATAEHNGTTYAQEGGNSVTVADGATAWLAMVDNTGGYTSDNEWYVPVINANSEQNNLNTYGAERQQKMVTDMSVEVERAEMGTHTWTANDKTYTHYTITLNMKDLILPTSEDVMSDYDLYKVRAWRQVDPDLLNEEVLVGAIHEGKNRPERATASGEFMMEEVDHAMFSKSTVVDGIGSMYFLGDNEDLESFYPTWTQPGSGEVMGTFGAQRLRLKSDVEYDEGGIDELTMRFIIRAYYTRTANLDQSIPNHMPGNRDGETAADGKYYIMEYSFDYTLDIDNQPITGVNSVWADREVVGVTYVNTLGMQSSKPFEGVNIVVTRYNDGSITTTKVVLK